MLGQINKKANIDDLFIMQKTGSFLKRIVHLGAALEFLHYPPIEHSGPELQIKQTKF